MNNDNFTPLQPGEPREHRGGGIRGGSKKTRFYRDQLKSNPEKWFVWKTQSPHGSDTGQALRTLVGKQTLTGVDRSTLPFEATAQKQEDGTYTTFVRYTGEREETVEFTPLSEKSDTLTNPFGVSN